MADEHPYFIVPSDRILTYRELLALAGRRMPYLTDAFTHPATGRYRPDCIEFLLVTAGTGVRRVFGHDGTAVEHPMRPGQLYVLRPMDLQQITGSGRAGLSVMSVAFAVETWSRFVLASELDERPFVGPETPMIEIDLADASMMRPFHRIMRAFPRRLDMMDLIRFLAKTTPWFVKAARSEEEAPGGAPRWLRSAVAAMHEEDNLRSGVGRFTALGHVSHTHLWRCTRAYYGMSPTELVTGIRLHHAGLLLSSTDMSIATIADRCGFSSAAHFSNVFRRNRLVSPREYRAHSRSE